MYRLPWLALLIGVFSGSALADPVITEFMASNQDSIADENGEHSDWIEIYNPDDTATNLDGWSLTDSAKNLRKWVFPAVVLPAKTYLIVFASGKDRRVIGQNLHTNFSLSADGEYLGLIKPDGVTKTTEFAPTFPPQYSNISYGTSGSVADLAVLAQGSPARAEIPVDSSEGVVWRSREFDDSAWMSGALAVGFFNYNATSSVDLSAQLGLDVKAQMGGNNKSAYLRIPFTIDDPSTVKSIKLRITYDDGFAAFLNGTAIASANAPATLAYNSVATAQHSPATYVDYDASAFAGQLVAGTNVLAIQGLNTNNSSDFFASPELHVQVERGVGMTGYFATATPGVANGGPETIQLPQKVTFSKPSGTFTSSFTLTISGAAAGQQIRYILAAPSSGTGASVAAPIATSTLYTGPITVSSSSFIRACVYDPVTGQLGGPTTAQYLWLETANTNNTSSFTSNLPLAVLDDHGGGAPVGDTHKPAMFYLFDNAGGTASLKATPSFAGRAGFHIRGSTSAGYAKKGYSLETWNESNNDLKQSLLGLSSESDWVLSNPWKNDNIFIRNAFMYELSREVGHWASRTRSVEMFTNTNGGKLDYADYAGVYVLTEKIKSGKGRVDITSIQPEDTSGDALTGGYIFKQDRADEDETSWKTTAALGLVLVEPSSDHETPEQVAYIQNYIQTFETTLQNEKNAGFTTRNYRRYIDVADFIDIHMLNAFTLNPDSFRLSSFFTKDRNSRIKAGPLWDYDLALGTPTNANQIPRQWNLTHFSQGWWGMLFYDPEFEQGWVDRWWQLRAGPLSDANVSRIVNQLGNEIGEAAGDRDAARWPGTNGDTPYTGSYLGEVAALNTWLTSTDASNLGRTNWIDSQLAAPPAASLDSNVVTAGTTVALSGAGTIRYFLDGADPRPYGGGTTTSAATYGATISIAHTTVLKARRQGTFKPFAERPAMNWSAPLTRVYLVNEVFATASDVAVSEISYSPAPPSAAEKSAVMEVGAGDFEFIELRNIGSRVVNTFEMKFVEGAPFKELLLAPLSLAPGDTALVVKNREAFVARYGNSMNAKIVGEWGDGSLSNDGERIQILARDGTPLTDFTYPPIANGGTSLNRVAASWKSDVPSPGTNGPTYAQWKNFYFPAGGDLSADTADGDADAASNQTEYGRGTNPVSADDQAVFAPTFTPVNDGKNANFVFTFRKPVDRPSAQYQVQRSTDLVNWTPIADTLVSTSGDMETRVVNVSATSGNPLAAYYRLRTTVSP